MSALIEHITISFELQQIITVEQAWRYKVVPKNLHADTLILYADEKLFDEAQADELEIILGKKISVERIPGELILKALGTFYRKGASNGSVSPAERTIRASTDFLERLISEARELSSSDIHIECFEDKGRIRLRIDGLLVERYSIPKEEYPSLVNKIKIRSNLDIAEKRLPQDGRIFFESEGKKTDIRVSVMPSLYAEKVVLRLLNNDAGNIDITGLGLERTALESYLEGIRKPHGIVLISGPTGSGKTTTLYATLKLLNKTTSNILTIEDPIEYTLKGVTQVQLREDIGLTFPGTLKTFLRQDPDIIMVGEIRDAETAKMAVRASLTGHLVLSTIHTNSAIGTISRLIDLGIPPFLISNTLNLSVAQRLVRMLCPQCKRKEKFRSGILPRDFILPVPVEAYYTPAGCPACHYTGYKGRKAIYEVIRIDHPLAEMIRTGAPGIAESIKEKGIKTLSDNAFAVFREGMTSADEIYSMLLHQ